MSSEWFNDVKDSDDIASERDLYGFIKNHYDNYSVLPDFSVFVNYGVDIENDVRNGGHRTTPQKRGLPRTIVSHTLEKVG